MEIIEHGNLLEALSKIKKSKVKFTERDAASIIQQILLALNFIHGSKIIHRDLKLENIMVDVEENEEGKTNIKFKQTRHFKVYKCISKV